MTLKSSAVLLYSTLDQIQGAALLFGEHAFDPRVTTKPGDRAID
jgi:hypothetical protein